MGSNEYFDTGEGLIMKNQNGKVTQENTLLNYDFKADIKKISSPRYVTFKGKVNGRLQVDKHNYKSAFLIYLEHDGYDIRIPVSFELMCLLIEVRNSFYDAEPVLNPFYNVEGSSLEFKNLSFTPKLIELLTTKRIKLNEEKREQILLKNAKEIFAMKDKHSIDVRAFLRGEEAKKKQYLDS